MSDDDEIKRLRSDNLQLTRMLADALAREVVRDADDLAAQVRAASQLREARDALDSVRAARERLRSIVDKAIRWHLSGTMSEAEETGTALEAAIDVELALRAKNTDHALTCPQWWHPIDLVKPCTCEQKERAT